ncbi:hypothetical protein PHSY_001866 [Pseudozyma hubeiensis SY62]|uniref:Uncharacterized protein n=1 Tax=Pseudozyma hubeiensis (strain SY62) TaxID=1305764 RepID=R9P895_PSEHS|nr:hypothetical protein PHSY_001866 [Pseudozyma hubeiensis SY62]GAC94295.1 hypothetical protein PHSY_001866 [Pseudozyma hubeiensis SY62]
MNETSGVYGAPGGGSSTPTSSVAAHSSVPAQYSSSISNDSDDSNGVASTASMTPDVVANPWNTSLLWSSGIVDNRDPRSSFWPASNWHNISVPQNVDTAPIGYYYSSSTAGDSVNFYFTGHGLSVLDYRGPTRGKYNVTIDNVTSVIVDAYSNVDELAKSSGTELPPAIWTSETFEEGTHYVVMSNLNNITDMNFWGVVINPNNYRPGKSFKAPASNTKVIVIASTVTAVVMIGIFLLVGSLVYYYKLLRPRRLLQQQLDLERKEALLPPSSSSTNLDVPASPTSSRLRLDTNFLASQGDLGRVPSRVTATTNESQYWVRSETELAHFQETRQSSRTPALFQEIRLESAQDSPLYSPVDCSPVCEMGMGSTIYSTEFGRPLSPLSPTNPAYATAQTPAYQLPFSQSRPVPNTCETTNQPPSHQHLGSLNLNSSANSPTVPGEHASLSHSHHHRAASVPMAYTSRDPSAPATVTDLVRTGSRRPLPTPPTTVSPISPMTTFPPSAQPSIVATATPPSSVSVGRSASQRYRVEQDACSFRLSDDGIFDDHTGEALLPPPYAPRDMGRRFA